MSSREEIDVREMLKKGKIVIIGDQSLKDKFSSKEKDRIVVVLR